MVLFSFFCTARSHVPQKSLLHLLNELDDANECLYYNHQNFVKEMVTQIIDYAWWKIRFFFFTP